MSEFPVVLSAEEWAPVLAALNYTIRELPLIAERLRDVRDSIASQLDIDISDMAA